MVALNLTQMQSHARRNPPALGLHARRASWFTMLLTAFRPNPQPKSLCSSHSLIPRWHLRPYNSLTQEEACQRAGAQEGWKGSQTHPIQHSNSHPHRSPRGPEQALHQSILHHAVTGKVTDHPYEALSCFFTGSSMKKHLGTKVSSPFPKRGETGTSNGKATKAIHLPQVHLHLPANVRTKCHAHSSLEV
jgi:hypothetical protein